VDKADVGCVRANNEDNVGYDIERRIFYSAMELGLGNG
jgi:hypothetical protein